MITALTHITLAVRDYDEAVRWYTEKLGFELRVDETFGEGHRFVTIGVPGQDIQVVMHVPQGDFDEAASSVHGFVLATDDCLVEVDELRSRGVEIVQSPQAVPWGIQAVFEDLYGNSHVLVEASRPEVYEE